jgi:hypothetical protein
LNFRIYTEHIPGIKNILSDELSRKFRHDNWQVNASIFKYFNKKWGPYDIDRFASKSNTHCKRFNTKYYEHGTEAVNAFTQKWFGVNNWVNSDLNLKHRVIWHCKNSKDKMT